jgi:hypothetical protein
VAVEAKSSQVSDVEQRIGEVRAKVPEAHRAEFDELLGEARLMYRLRDERGVFSDIWASGLMRRAPLVGGKRLAARGRIHEAAHFVDAGFDEMCGLFARLRCAFRGRARRARSIPGDPSGQGRSARARASAAPAAGHVQPPSGAGANDARGWGRPAGFVRQL